MSGKNGKSVKEILNEKKAKTLGLQNSLPLTFEMHWLSQVAEATESFVPPLTAKEKGMLKLFANRCPDGEAAVVLEAVVGHWGYFTQHVMGDAGIKYTPDKPRIDFLLKHVGTAVNFAHKLAKQAAQPPKPAPAASQPKPQLQSIAEALSLSLSSETKTTCRRPWKRCWRS